MRFEPEAFCTSVREATVIWYRSGTQFTFRCDLDTSPTPQNLRQIGAPMSLSGANEMSPIVSRGMIETSREYAAKAISRYRSEHASRQKTLRNPYQMSFMFH